MPAPVATKSVGAPASHPFNLAAAIRSQLRDPSLSVLPGEADRELKASKLLESQIPAAQRHSGALVLPPKATLTGAPVSGQPVTLEQVVRPEQALSRLGAGRYELGIGYSARRLVSPSRVAVGWVNTDTGEAEVVRTVTFGETGIRPREGSIRIDVTRSFLKNATEANEMLRDVMSEAHESEAERVQIAGSGNGMEPMGILAAAEAGAVPSAAGSISYAGLTAALQLALDAGARLRQCGILLSQADWGAAVALERTGGHPALVEGPDGYWLARRPVEFSPWLPSGHAVIGEFAQVGIYYQGLPQLLVNPYTRAAQQITEITVFDTYDVGVKKPNLLRVITP